MRTKTYKTYSTEIKTAIIESRNVNLFPDLKIPRSTAYHWIARGLPSQVKLDLAPRGCQSVDHQIYSTGVVASLTRIVAIMFAILPADILFKNVPEFKELTALFKAIDIAWIQKTLSNKVAHLFKPTLACKSSIDGGCLRKNPGRLTGSETETMKRLVTSKKYGHMSIISLCLYAKRQGSLLCSHDTWYRYINKFGWERPIKKWKSPKRKLVGLRASKPNKIWHIDATQIKTEHGRVFYLQALVDNFSRLVLAWRVSSAINAEATVALILKALKTHSPKEQLDLISDGGTENVNTTVAAMMNGHEAPKIIHRLAKHQIDKSNSMAENLFHKLKTDYLNHCALNSREDIIEHVGFYIAQKNDVMPQLALKGLTPAEAYAGHSASELCERLKRATSEQRVARKNHNRTYVCGACA